MKLKRWVVRCYDRNGEVRAEERFWLRRNAHAFADWQEATASGSHWFMTPVAAKIIEEHGPLWTVMVVKE